MATTTKKPSGTQKNNMVMPSKTTKSQQASKAGAASQKSMTPKAKATSTTQRTQHTNSKKSAEFAQDMTKLDDVALISDILTTEKNLIGRYGVALTEISCEKLRKLVTAKMSECAQDQFDAFVYMNTRNQYPTEPAPLDKLSQAKQKYNSKCQAMKK